LDISPNQRTLLGGGIDGRGCGVISFHFLFILI
jgi:hypothetical protein